MIRLLISLYSVTPLVPGIRTGESRWRTFTCNIPEHTCDVTTIAKGFVTGEVLVLTSNSSKNNVRDGGIYRLVDPFRHVRTRNTTLWDLHIDVDITEM